jgi:hypothetical protein
MSGRATTFPAWNPRTSTENTHIQLQTEDGSYELCGRILEESADGNSRQRMTLACGNETVSLVLDAEQYIETSVWMTIKHAHKLLCKGVTIKATARLNASDSCKNGTECFKFHAESITIESVLPSTPYLARLLSFPMQSLTLLFPGQTSDALPLSLVHALCPCDEPTLNQLYQLCCDERAAGRMATLFKHEALQEACAAIQEFHGWSRARVNRPPPTKRFAWQSLERLEAVWCRDVVDGPAQEYGFVARDEHGYSKNMRVDSVLQTEILEARCIVPDDALRVDPSFNIPDKTDARRLLYVNKRKRPQIQAMLEIILKLCEYDPSSDPIRRQLSFVDVGGGRGDLAMAVASFLSQRQYQVHVTVLDNNASSLSAGQDRAKELGLDAFMSFVLCDVSDQSQTENVLEKSQPYYDLFFGLHCCGGLAEASMELALRAGAKFCISTCCFRSNRSLATLTDFSETLQVRVDGCPDLETYRSDLNRVSAVAIGGSIGGQHRAIRVLNAIRLRAAEARYQELKEKQVGTFKRKLVVRQETFPIEYSVQNRVLVGSYLD